MLEILAPAGNAACAAAAINNGADAVYLGYSSFSARQSAENFDVDGLSAVIRNAHFNGVKIYVAMNTVVKETEMDEFFSTIATVWRLGADAIILQDALLGRVLHSRYPDIVLHLSTQAGVCTVEGAIFAKECGFSRVILARETPLEEIKKITKIIETETFIQGALCTCFSGQCYFSSFVGGNSGNRGRCKQPCRKLYSYDRNGFEDKTYALSLSDLSVSEDIEKLIEAGVVSFKIEGRMRREEYVAAAVRYYRLILDKKAGKEQALSDLKRTYNRGNYTKGLAFGQDKRFLSPAVQGHIGEKVGVVKVENAKYYVESRFSPRKGDAFKILRNGKEVGGAMFSELKNRGFVISSKTRLLNGDSVFITTDSTVNERVLNAEKREQISISLCFKENEKAVAKWKEFTVLSDEVLQSADNRALTKEEITNCFLKTDGLPIEIAFDKICLEGNIFIPKSQLNAFRRKFYTQLSQCITVQNHKQYEVLQIEKINLTGKNEKTAVIANDFTGLRTDIAVYKPQSYLEPLPNSFTKGDFEKYLYYPAFCTSKDIQILEKWLQETTIDGIYIENYGGIVFAKRNGLKIFAGTGLNLFNSAAINELLTIPNVVYYAISKELNAEELQTLIGEKAFVLSSGDIKLMDLCYCPFAKTCNVCEKKSLYTLTDENNREFPVNRYTSADGSCRFEVYNCANLISKGINGAGKLLDLTITNDKKTAFEARHDEEKQKDIYKKYTSGHLKRGVL
ncbi:MAG: U32 family peptidase [Clostridia bacterium]|nr:U32 family peptidase [Clostridia bacterium]